MSAYGAGKMAEGVIGFLFILVCAIGAVAGLIGLAAPVLGPVGLAVVAAAIVYVVGAFFTGSWLPTTGLRIGSMLGGAAGAWCGAHVYQSMGGIGGVLLGAVVTGVLVGVGVGIGFIATGFLIADDKKKTKA